MKRTLLEIACGLAVLVLLASFQHQVARLKVQNQEVEDLRKLVEATASKATSKDEVVHVREQVLGQLEERLADLEGRLASAAAGSILESEPSRIGWAMPSSNKRRAAVMTRTSSPSGSTTVCWLRRAAAKKRSSMSITQMPLPFNVRPVST